MAAITALTLGASAYSQHTTASVNGTITDTSGGVIPGADVTLTDIETNVVAHTTTTAAGISPSSL